MFDLEYKKHIQFLRGFSVLCIFLFHTNIPLFKKGYLGIDIFFVISGFVITKTIFQGYLSEKKINLSNFYINRIKKIIPNLFFIVGTTYFIYLIFGPPNMGLWNEIFGVFLGISNIYYLTSRTDYFDGIFDDPLAHTWSIGVIQQFYIIYPLLIFLIFLSKEKKFFNLQIFFLISFTTSIFFFHYNLNNNPLFSFYSTSMRLWELIFGGILFFYKLKIKKNNIISIGSLLLIIYLIFTPSNFNYLYLNLIIVILSGVFIIFFSKSEIFEKNPLIYLGNISFSFYLWHLPVLYFFELYILNIFYLDVVLSFIFTLILSVASYTLIEKKFRYLNFASYKKYAYYSISFFTLIFIFLVYIKYSNNDVKKILRTFLNNSNYLNLEHNWNHRFAFQDRLSVNEKSIYEYCKDDSKNFIKNSDKLKLECLKQKNYKTLFFVEGSSHTAQYLPMLIKSELIENIYYKHRTDYEISFELVNELSNKFDEVIYLTDLQIAPKLKILASVYPKFNEKIKFILFKPNHYPKNIFQPSKCLIQQQTCKIFKNEDFKKRNLTELFHNIDKFKNSNEGIFIFNTYENLCPSFECTIYDKNKDLLMLRDQSHLSIEGAESLVSKFDEYIQLLRDQNQINNFKN